MQGVVAEARYRSIGFSEECLGLHYGHIHDADLGDGDGRKPEQFLARQYYFPVWGTCWESVAGQLNAIKFHNSLLTLAQEGTISELGNRMGPPQILARGF